jgi:serine protease AprX
VKPDLVAPGVTVTAAQAGAVSGYATYSGTSMATPYVSGAVALALHAATTQDLSPTPGQVKAALLDTALDVGAAGKDNEWGAGLLDVRALVDRFSTVDVGVTAFPAVQGGSHTVPTGAQVEVPVEVPADALGVPLAVTLTQTSGSWSCDLLCAIGWSAGEWTPDLDLELRDPAGVVVATSECALSGLVCRSGRQETVALRPTLAGTYTLRVYVWPDGSGAGGPFLLDVSRGPLVSGATVEPVPAPENVPPVADAGEDQSVTADRKTATATFTLDGSASYDPDGTTGGLTYAWVGPDGPLGGDAVVTDTRPASADPYVYTLTVSDTDGAGSTDTVAVTVSSKAGGGGGGGGKGGGKAGGGKLG